MNGAKALRSRSRTASNGKTASRFSAQRNADELMDLAIEASQSRHLSNFLKQFAMRSARMLDASWGGVVVSEGRETEFYEIPGKHGSAFQLAQAWVLSNDAEIQGEMETRSLPDEIAASMGGEETSEAAVFVRIASSDKEKLGTLCLFRKRKTLTADEKHLARALASHAALSLENFRRFSQLERSKRQWVEDIDAISDYIVVHDRSWRIVRTNRSLASYLGVPPVALVGEAMSSLRQIAEAGSDLPCPFCRDTQRMHEEYVAASAERVFLISTSRTPGATDDDSRTIHVLKDITDRREAERRYRELFDSIQEGLFFATPEGRFWKKEFCEITRNRCAEKTARCYIRCKTSLRCTTPEGALYKYAA